MVNAIKRFEASGKDGRLEAYCYFSNTNDIEIYATSGDRDWPIQVLVTVPLKQWRKLNRLIEAEYTRYEDSKNETQRKPRIANDKRNHGSGDAPG